MTLPEDLGYSIELFDLDGNLVEVLARLKSVDAAHAAYDVQLTMARQPGPVLTLRQKAQVLRRSDRG
jgi:predicted RNA polymerase sigma factor